LQHDSAIEPKQLAFQARIKRELYARTTEPEIPDGGPFFLGAAIFT
jgi:hypothetical protein